jgi:putative cardiolipin synthase
MTLFKAGSVRARISSYFVAAAVVVLSLGLTGCGTVPPNTGKADVVALPLNPDSPLVKIAKASSPGEDQTGVRLLPLGAYSLDTRLQLAQRATTSLDVQYYQFENDPTGGSC